MPSLIISVKKDNGSCQQYVSGDYPQKGDTLTNYRYTGKLSKLTSVGLYFYNAGWMDPAISHFVQADTIVPGIGDPKAWDRYAYVLWNPLRLVDPSGNVVRAYTDSWEGTPFSVKYGVIFTGKWSNKSMHEAMNAVKQVSSAISKAVYTNAGTHIDQGGGFKQAFGKMTFQSVSKSNICDGCSGQTLYPLIKFVDNEVSERLVGHELGHAFEKTIWNRNGEKYAGTINPVQFLVQKGIYDGNGSLVTGFSPSLGTYTRWNNRSAPENGFASDYIPDQYHGRDFDDWNDVGEGFADIFLNWAYDSFDKSITGSAAGNAMYAWTATNMASWINSGY